MKETFVKIGSTAVAFLASLCCIGPIMLAGLGLGGAGVIAGLEAYRPYMMAVVFIFLSGAFYITYRKREEICEDGTCKVKRGSKSSKITLWSVTALTLFFLAFPYIDWSGGDAYLEADENTAFAQTSVSIEGMTCASCDTGVEIAVSKLPGVAQVSANHKKGSALVNYYPDQVNVQQIVNAINHLGYKAEMPGADSGGSKSKPAADLTDIHDFNIIKSVFEKDKGNVRFITLLSPT